MKAYERVGVEIHVFLTLAAVAMWWASRPWRKSHRYPFTRREWVNQRVGMDAMGTRRFLTLPGLERQPSLVAMPTALSLFLYSWKFCSESKFRKYSFPFEMCQFSNTCFLKCTPCFSLEEGSCKCVVLNLVSVHLCLNHALYSTTQYPVSLSLLPARIL